MDRNLPESATACCLARDTRGNSIVEYVILVGVVVLLSIQAFATFGTQVSGKVKEQVLDPAKMGL